ncbi:MAG: DUF983 domain-containing protein [Geminicoccaceae bacterium]|nr:DUF983 domain-containing protein [Geminicoccaceae bacterium]MCB9943295.1 DUF983 domain-containing protein [Geminicoccaceae bacterium]
MSVSPISAGLGCRCPNCGKGPLFDGFLTVRKKCEHCGVDLAGQDSGDGPVAFIILIVGFVVVGAALVVEVKYGWPVWLHMVVWLPLALVGCLGLMRPAKSLLIAMQFRHLRHSFEGERPDRT